MEMTAEEEKVGDVAPTLRPIVLPSVSMKLIMGGKVFRRGGNIHVSFEGESVLMTERDFDVAAKVAKKVKQTLGIDGIKDVSGTTLIEAFDLTRKHVSELVFFPDSIRVLYFPVLSRASAYYRCHLPASAVSQGSKVVAHVHRGDVARVALEYDVVVFQIDHSVRTIQFAKTLKSMGKKIVYEIDDAFDALQPWHPGYGTYSTPEVQARVRDMMGLADVVTVTTEFLKERYSDFAKRIEVLPNYLPLAEWPKSQPHGFDEFRIVWAGSPSHRGDLEEIAAPLRKFLLLHEDSRIYFFGDAPEKFLPGSDQVRTIPFVPFSEYPIALASVQADIAVAPLQNCSFNWAKSNIKVLEYAATGYPTLASRVGPYKDTIEHRRSGMLCSDSKEWFATLEEMYHDKPLRASILEGARRMVEKYDLARNATKIENFFCGLGAKP